MATSKSSDSGKASSARSRKIVDVAQPGKTPAQPTAKPIIVGNRPLLRRDPMVAPLGSLDKHDDITPVSRVAKTIKVTGVAPIKPSDDATTAAPAPATSRPMAPTIGDLTKKATAKSTIVVKPAEPETPAEDSTAIEAPAPPKSMNTVPKEEEEKVAREVGIEVVTSLVKDPTAPVLPARSTTESDITVDEPEAQPMSAPAAEPAPEEETAPNTDDEMPDPTQPAEQKGLLIRTPPKRIEPLSQQEATPAAPVATVSEPTTPESKPVEAAAPVATPTPTPASATSVPDEEEEDDTDNQLAPNQIVDQAKRKEEDEKAAKLAEQEKIIASKQFYLPITAPEKRRGLARVLLLLVLVVIFALVWLDIVLDAGIVHIAGLHALTHFFHQ